jgi:hypothetical protein
MDTILKNIIESYNSLWSAKIHGKTIEVITPVSTTNDMFVSVFITQRDGEFIATDGGWIDYEVYKTSLDFSDESFNRLFLYYKEQYGIKETSGKGRIFYYKKTDKKELLPNLVYDLSNFISVVVSSSFVIFQDIKEKENIERFKRQANNYLSSIIDKEDVKFGSCIDEKYKNIRFSAVVIKKNRFVLINYVTGSNDFNFINSIGKANLNFEIIDKSSFSQFVNKKITIVNNSAPGYNIKKIGQYLDLITSKTQSANINWSEKEKIKELIY